MLDPIVSSLDEVSEAFRGEYREGTKDEGAEGKFVLQVVQSGGWSLENTEGLRTALAAEKEKARKVKDALGKFEGLDADEVRTKIEKLQELEESGGSPDQKKLQEQAVAAARTEVANKFQTQLDERDKRLTEHVQMVEKLTRFAEIDSTIAKHKGNAALLRDHLVAISKSEVVEGKDVPQTKVLDPETKLARVSQRGGSTDDMTLDEYVESLAKDKTWSAAFHRENDNQGPGLGDRGQNNNNGSQRRTTNTDQLNPTARLASIYEQQSGGGR